MLEKLSSYLPIDKAQSNWKLAIGVSATLIAAVAFIAKRILSKAQFEPVEDPTIIYRHPGPTKILNKLLFNAQDLEQFSEDLIHDMSAHLEVQLSKMETLLYDSFSIENLSAFLNDDSPAVMITFSGVTYACTKKDDFYRVFIPQYSTKFENRATILDFPSIETLFAHLLGEEGVDIEYPLDSTVERFMIQDTFQSLENKAFSFEEVKKLLDDNWLLKSRFSFSEDVNQDYFDEFNKTNPLEHPANRMKLLAGIYKVNYSPIILTPLKICEEDINLLYENASKE